MGRIGGINILFFKTLFVPCLYMGTNNDYKSLEKKEFYKKNLPHLQIQGQTFFVTWLLTGTLSNKTILQLKDDFHKKKLAIKEESESVKDDLKFAYHSYFVEFDDRIHTLPSSKHLLNNNKLAQQVANAIHYWDKKRIDLYCYCIMSNHVHAVFTVFEESEDGKQLYLQDIMKSIKNFSAKQCNKILGRTGQFWHHESYDRLVRDRNELYRVICYVLDNPIKAGLCSERRE